MRSDAVAVALAVARGLGLRVEDPVVLRDAWHALVHLRPAGVVARVSTTVPFPVGPHPDDVVRELAIAAHAARAGAPVIPPADEVDPGPHRHNGRIVTLWRYVEPAGDFDPREAGRHLRLIHDALADCDDPLPPAGHPLDLAAMLDAIEPSSRLDILREVAAAVVPPTGGQALHGDAHLGNCLRTSLGPLWHDLECACRGPREYDLAALVLADRHSGFSPARAALEGYGDHDGELLDALVPLYAVWVYASLLIALPRRPDLADFPWEERLAWLRAIARGSA